MHGCDKSDGTQKKKERGDRQTDRERERERKEIYIDFRGTVVRTRARFAPSAAHLSFAREH